MMLNASCDTKSLKQIVFDFEENIKISPPQFRQMGEPKDWGVLNCNRNSTPIRSGTEQELIDLKHFSIQNKLENDTTHNSKQKDESRTAGARARKNRKTLFKSGRGGRPPPTLTGGRAAPLRRARARARARALSTRAENQKSPSNPGFCYENPNNEVLPRIGGLPFRNDQFSNDI